MISQKTLKAIEYDKIVAQVSNFATLYRTKNFLKEFMPVNSVEEVAFLLAKTQEAYDLLYKYNCSNVYFFEDITTELERVDIGGTLNNAELLRVAQNLKGARILKNSILSVKDENIKILPEIANRIFVNDEFEKEISSKILSEDQVSDNASPKLYSIRKHISNLNVEIRNKLNSYIRGGLNNYLQDAVVTIRQDRYVVPVKTEYRSFVKGFIHDQSSSGATVYIEPEQVMELNNELKKALLEENAEIYRILADLSNKITYMSNSLRYNAENVQEIDESYARAQYSFENKCVKPVLNSKGYINIINGRHPLIDKSRVVPVSVQFGSEYNFLLITGPNTGGKTVTLKLVGLLSIMAMSGLFVPATSGTHLSVFKNVYCDIGDEQSIEQNLSTFSSHIKNLIQIINNVDENCLVLIDEIGAGTDPEEGTAIALAVIKKLISLNCSGVITTHYSRLKEFAMESGRIENASMEFDSSSLKPLYKLNIGLPGSSNAIDIAKTLGLDLSIVNDAISYLSDDKVSFELVLKKAEESKKIADDLSKELQRLKSEKENELLKIKEEREKIAKEREKIFANAKQETKRIVSDKLVEAEEIIDELKDILKTAQLETKEVFRASTLKNRLQNSRYLNVDSDSLPVELVKPNLNELKVGNKVFVKSLGAYAKILSIKSKKSDAEVLVGDNMRAQVKIEDLYNSEQEVLDEKPVKVFRNTLKNSLSSDINVIGRTSLEALSLVQDFIDMAVVNGLQEIKIIHGVGEGILLKTIRDYLKTDKNVLEYRRGKYGEGENGVTFVKLK